MEVITSNDEAVKEVESNTAQTADETKRNLDIIIPSISIGKCEKFDVNMLKYILSLPIDNEDKIKLKKMKKNLDRGNKLQINYILGKSAKQNKFGKEFMGRLVPQGNYGLQTLSSDIRKALAKDYYWDLDIVNCHCEILNQMALKHGWTNKYLTDLCTKRDDIFKQIMEESSIDRNAVKVIFLSILFGGACKPSYNDWITNHFYPEVNLIMKNLSSLHPDVLKYAKTKNPHNPIGCACSLILQNEERKCLLTLDEFMCINKRSMDTFIHDGGLVERLLNETEFPETLISKAEAFLKERTSYDLKLVVKPMTSTYSKPHDIEEGRSYIEVKIDFEQYAFLCTEEAMFYYIKNDKVTMFSKNQLLISFMHIKFDKIVDSGIETVSFIPVWVQDSMIRRYNNIGLFVPPFKTPENCFNTWNGLPVQRFQDTIITDEVRNDVQFVKDHIKLLCNNDERSFKYVWNWFSYMFQHPALKNNIALLFKSIKQGMGKNLLFEIIQKLLGSEYSCIIFKPESEVFGTFNSIMENKILVMFDEFAGRLGFKYDDELKALVSGTEINIVKKGRDPRICNNYSKIIFNTNNDFPVKIAYDDRRFFICDCQQEVPPKEYFDRLVRIKSDKNVLKALYEDFMTTDLTGIDWIRDRPVTEAYEDLRMASLPTEIMYLLNFVQSKDEAKVEITAKNLYFGLVNYYVSVGMPVKQTQIQFGIRLKNLNIVGLTTKRTSKGMVYVFEINVVREFLQGKYGAI